MICPKCHTPFEIPANFCPHCGVSLQRSGARFLMITAALVLLLLTGVYGYVRYHFFKGTGAGAPTVCPNPNDLLGQPTDDLRAPSPEVLPPSDLRRTIPPARLSLAAISGREILNFPVAILSSGWIPVPRQPSIGGYTWQVTLASGHRLALEGGVLHNADPVGLWQLPVDSLHGLPELVPWVPDQPLAWQSLDDPQDKLIIRVGDIDLFSDVARVAFNNDAAGPGIFVQNGRVVGWSFGQLIPGGYLWMGNSGSELIPEFYTDDFYRLTFEGGREEAFLLALDDPHLSDFEQLGALVEAYRLQPRLTPGETPADIRPVRILATMRGLIAHLEAQGRSEEILALFDPRTVSLINHPQLVTDLAGIARQTGDYAYALALVDHLIPSFDTDVAERRKIAVLQAALYRDGLNQLIAADQIHDARRIYEEARHRFPQDAAIHLAGVELALQRRNWTLAERLLAARNYPIEMRETVRRLQQGISELKAQEGKIVIRYPSGSGTIPVTVTLDGRLRQRFLIDTGASIVTVPFATVRRLGIDLTDNLPRRLLYSATGVHNAIEVTLPSIELDGWTIEDVKALVVDLPGQSGVGLLGMNYLKNFRVDLNTREGMLLLEPR